MTAEVWTNCTKCGRRWIGDECPDCGPLKHISNYASDGPRSRPYIYGYSGNCILEKEDFRFNLRSGPIGAYSDD